MVRGRKQYGKYTQYTWYRGPSPVGAAWCRAGGNATPTARRPLPSPRRRRIARHDAAGPVAQWIERHASPPTRPRAGPTREAYRLVIGRSQVRILSGPMLHDWSWHGASAPSPPLVRAARPAWAAGRGLSGHGESPEVRVLGSSVSRPSPFGRVAAPRLSLHNGTLEQANQGPRASLIRSTARLRRRAFRSRPSHHSPTTHERRPSHVRLHAARLDSPPAPGDAAGRADPRFRAAPQLGGRVRLARRPVDAPRPVPRPRRRGRNVLHRRAAAHAPERHGRRRVHRRGRRARRAPRRRGQRERTRAEERSGALRPRDGGRARRRRDARRGARRPPRGGPGCAS
jgi:hypothetical protein